MSVKTLFPKKSTSEVLGIRASEYLFFFFFVGGHGSIHNTSITNIVCDSVTRWVEQSTGREWPSHKMQNEGENASSIGLWYSNSKRLSLSLCRLLRALHTLFNSLKKNPTGILTHFTEKGSEMKVFVTQSCPTFGDCVNCRLSNSSVHGILQARILEWVAVSSSRRPLQLRDWTQVSYIAGGFFTIWVTWEALTVKGIEA